MTRSDGLGSPAPLEQRLLYGDQGMPTAQSNVDIQCQSNPLRFLSDRPPTHSRNSRKGIEDV